MVATSSHSARYAEVSWLPSSLLLPSLHHPLATSSHVNKLFCFNFPCFALGFPSTCDQAPFSPLPQLQSTSHRIPGLEKRFVLPHPHLGPIIVPSCPPSRYKGAKQRKQVQGLFQSLDSEFLDSKH